MTSTNELLDTAISVKRLIWIMSDEDADIMLSLAKRHLGLVKESLQPTTTPERKCALKVEIEALRIERNDIIGKYRQEDWSETSC